MSKTSHETPSQPHGGTQTVRRVYGTKRPAPPGVGAMRREGDKLSGYQRSGSPTLLDDSAIVEVTPEALIGITPGGIVRTWNPAATRLFGYTAAEAIGKSVLRLSDPNQRAEQKEMLQRARAGQAAGPIETTRRRRNGTIVPVEITVVPLRDFNGQVVSLVGILRDISVRKLADAHKVMIVDELNHRVRNTLATVRSIVAQSLRGAASLDAFNITFAARMASLAVTHSLLTRSAWESVGISDLIESELTPYDHPAASRWRTSGPNLFFRPQQALALGMMVHELATNAAKYGALSTAGGHVDISWRTRSVGEIIRINLVWSETGGPRVEKPARTGFGTRLITDGLALELDGEVSLTFPHTGVRCEIDVPFELAKEAS